jgi:membrane protein required for colicin V production
MTIFDVILLIAISGFVFFGLFFGLIHTLGSLVGLVAGTWLAGHYYETVAESTKFMFGSQLNLSRIIIFIIIFTIANRLIGFLFYLIDKVFKIISIIPFLKTINRLLGAILGLVEGLLAVGLFLYVAAKYPISPWFTGVLEQSQVAPALAEVSKILTPLLPDALKQLQSIFF